jgi:23S rRNA pseudouridine1911/1915/1917 synthase
MASIKHPLIADVVYGGTCVPEMNRQALHACRLALDHPVTGVHMVFEAPLPADFMVLLGAWGLRYNP